MMAHLYHAASISRQGFSQWHHRLQKQKNTTPCSVVLQMAANIRRQSLPGAGARELYYFIRKRHESYSLALVGWGKHRFEALCLANNFRIFHRRFVPKTTIRGDYIFPNLIEGVEINDIDQIWVSDICYIFGSHGTLVGYATSLIDLYSRRLIGLSFSQSMRAEETARVVIEQAFLLRKKTTFGDLVFHSDGGKQYIETLFLAQLKARNIRSSMAENCYQNAFAEAFNDILKNHMLTQFDINSFSQLKSKEQFIKDCYNFNKPHNGIQRMTPSAFEQNILSLLPCQRTPLKIKKIEPFSTISDSLLSFQSS